MPENEVTREVSEEDRRLLEIMARSTSDNLDVERALARMVLSLERRLAAVEKVAHEPVSIPIGNIQARLAALESARGGEEREEQQQSDDGGWTYTLSCPECNYVWESPDGFVRRCPNCLADLSASAVPPSPEPAVAPQQEPENGAVREGAVHPWRKAWLAYRETEHFARHCLWEEEDEGAGLQAAFVEGWSASARVPCLGCAIARSAPHQQNPAPAPSPEQHAGGERERLIRNFRNAVEANVLASVHVDRRPYTERIAVAEAALLAALRAPAPVEHENPRTPKQLGDNAMASETGANPRTPVEQAAMAAALRQCAEWFQEYADGHREKGATEKAKRNQERATYAIRAIQGLPVAAPVEQRPEPRGFHAIWKACEAAGMGPQPDHLSGADHVCAFVRHITGAPEPTGREDWATLCVECGPNVKIDSDGCCVTCGATAIGTGPQIEDGWEPAQCVHNLAAYALYAARSDVDRDNVRRWKRRVLKALSAPVEQRPEPFGYVNRFTPELVRKQGFGGLSGINREPSDVFTVPVYLDSLVAAARPEEPEQGKAEGEVRHGFVSDERMGADGSRVVYFCDRLHRPHYKPATLIVGALSSAQPEREGQPERGFGDHRAAYPEQYEGQPEPVAWGVWWDSGACFVCPPDLRRADAEERATNTGCRVVPLYASPPAPERMEERERHLKALEEIAAVHPFGGLTGQYCQEIARAALLRSAGPSRETEER